MCRIPFLVIALVLILSAACNRPAATPLDKSPPSQKTEITAEDEITPPPTSPPPRRATTPAPRPLRASSPAPFPRQLPPSPSPFGWSGVVMRLEFYYPSQHICYLGTGFVVRDRAKADWLITCAHLIGEKAWQDRYQVTMRTMKGDRIIRSFGTTLHVGASVDVYHATRHGWPDMTQDLVVRLVAGEWVQPLPLAKADPQVGDWVWAVGCEAHRPPSDEHLFLGRIVEVADGAYVLKKQVDFVPGGFSGGPILNTRGEVIGNLLAGRGDLVSGATVSTLRRRLKAKGIVVD